MFWKNIFSIVESKVQSLRINNNDSFASLKLVPNVKSIIISSSYSLAEEHLELILKIDRFKKIRSLIMKFNELFFTPSLYDNSVNQDLLL
ncbi:unnamed protein product [Rotaria sp. Silwood2]|nr:unnamed protein product [Rotaria sp. Silwood2]CAF2480254.1 unnamed protein product [Rotaria sp. Silwood2]CAF2739694.1 unnamed protein product [Rotaria sp. Silwood2]CAF2864606.1 unnamed protein product [Rotaria sp. Silwood2]CAF4398323.1 unnamed protein product [Rotaria sp. Silwood2]